MTVKLLLPSKAQLEAIRTYLNLDSGEVSDVFMKSLERGAGYIEQYDFPVPLPSRSGYKRLSIAMPGQSGLKPIFLVPLEASGLALKIERPHVDGAHPIVVCVYALEDFDALVREAGKEYSAVMMSELLERLAGVLRQEDVVSIVEETLAESNLGLIFKAYRSAAAISDAIEEVPAKTARSFLPRRG